MPLEVCNIYTLLAGFKKRFIEKLKKLNKNKVFLLLLNIIYIAISIVIKTQNTKQNCKMPVTGLMTNICKILFGFKL